MVTQGYNGRGLPYSLSGTTAGSLVTSTLYNGLGSMTDLNLNNGATTTFGYYGTGGSHDTTGGYYGKLWEIKTYKPGNNAIQDMQHTWNAGGNLTQRQNLVASDTEYFTYDYLDRLITAYGSTSPYSQSFSYDVLGNITSMNGNTYAYGTKPHAVTGVGAASYAYDANGNMTTRGSQTLTWDVENRPLTVTGGDSFVYDGDGNRVKKTENSNTVVYIGKYYEKNVTTGVITTYYYLGDKLVATRQGTTLNYIQQDHLTGTSVASDASGASVGTITYFPFGVSRNSQGNLPTDKLFTGQRLDTAGLYYYGARYYDPEIGRFISADTIVPNWKNPQSLNRYSYCLNNPLKYIDPTGHEGEEWEFTPPPGYDDYLNFVRAGYNITYSQYSSYQRENLHNARNMLATLPIVGTPFDIANGVSYYEESDYINAAISFFGIVPFFGDIVEAAKELKGIKELNCLKTVKAGAELRVIGRTGEYEEVASALGAKHFKIPAEIWNGMNETERWAANQKFLDRGIANNAEFLLVDSGSLPGGYYFQQEVSYLIEKGYKLSVDGTKLIPK